MSSRRHVGDEICHSQGLREPVAEQHHRGAASGRGRTTAATAATTTGAAACTATVGTGANFKGGVLYKFTDTVAMELDMMTTRHDVNDTVKQQLRMGDGGNVSFYAETRYHYIRGKGQPTGGSGSQTGTNTNSQLLPITFGFRF